MGWNSWNSGIPLTERTVEQTIDAMVSSGMRDAGYRYVNLDAGWAAPTRDADGNLRADPDRFPHGIAALARYAHDRGMYLGHVPQPVQPGLRSGSAHRRQRVTNAPTRRRSPTGASTTSSTTGAGSKPTTTSRSSTSPRCGMRCAPAVVASSTASTRTVRATRGPDAKYDWSRIADMSRDSIDLVPAWGDDALWAEGARGCQRRRSATAVPLAPRSRPDPRQRSGHAGGRHSRGPSSPTATPRCPRAAAARPDRRRAARALLAVGDAGRAAAGGQRRPVDEPADPRHPDQPRRDRRRPGSACGAGHARCRPTHG